ncbi:MAG: substrate-binding domain-containing protein [Gemmatimonadaceae bacterium]
MNSAGIRHGLEAALVTVLLAPIPAALAAQEPAAPSTPAAIVRVYGPGGPAPAMREAAARFGAQQGITVIVSAGPTPVWKDQAAKDADLIYSGSEYMMTDFVRRDLPGVIDTSTIRTLYLRPSALLVRPGNPKGITSIRDLTKPGIKVLVVEGAGQVGMWEDVAGRTGDARLVGDVRRHIGAFAANSAEAKKLWNSDSSYDAWLIWTIWQKESPASADLVRIEPEHTIYRSTGIAVTHRSALRNLAGAFADFLQSGEGRAIFQKWGWTAPAP